MKKILTMAAAVLALMATGCSKEDASSSGSADSSMTVNSNELVYDGVKYPGTGHATLNTHGIDFECYDESRSFAIYGNVESSAYNGTYDISQHNEGITLTFHVGIGTENAGAPVLDLRFQNMPQNFWCFLDGESLSESAFTSGTATVKVTDGKVSISVQGTLMNGKGIAFNIAYDTAIVIQATEEG